MICISGLLRMAISKLVSLDIAECSVEVAVRAELSNSGFWDASEWNAPPPSF